MTKNEIKQRVLQNGKPLDLKKFSWDEKTNTFSSIEDNLVLDFGIIDDCTFNTGSSCTFNTGSSCTFNTGDYCTFDTGYSCTFNTGYACTFDTWDNCTFNTGSSCTFNTGDYCTFNTGSYCTFKTGSYCTFDTGYSCTFNTGDNCTFDCYKKGYIINKKKSCALILRDNNKKIIYDLDTLEKGKFIKFEFEKEPIFKDIIETKFIDDGIYTILKTVEDSRQKDNIYNLHNVKKIDDYFNDINKILIVAEKEYEWKKYYAHGENIAQAKADVNFKIASENFPREKIASDIKEKGNIINWYDYRLVTGSCEIGTKDWLEENNLTTENTMVISDFVKKFKDKGVYEFNRFEDFYNEFFG